MQKDMTRQRRNTNGQDIHYKMIKLTGSLKYVNALKKYYPHGIRPVTLRLLKCLAKMRKCGRNWTLTAGLVF